MTQKEITLTIEEVGMVKFVRRAQSKKMKLSVTPTKGITVSLPYYTSFETAKTFVKENVLWIKEQQQKINKNELQPTHFTPTTNFSTLTHKLYFQKSLSQNYCNINDKKIIISYTDENIFKSDDFQLFIRRNIEEVFRSEANYFIKKRTYELAEIHNFKFNDITCKNIKTRWGSCSAMNNLNFNVHLIRLPEYLRDYVILHELLHTKIKNHSQQFWDELEKLLPNAIKIDKDLNLYNPQIY